MVESSTTFVLGLLLGLAMCACSFADEPVAFDNLDHDYTADVRPLLTSYCLDCHSTADKQGELDLERFSGFAAVRSDPAAWQQVRRMLATGEMPPEQSDQPTDDERQRLQGWVDRYLDAEARAGAGDPGPVVLRRLSNAEYTSSIRDLTGVPLDPASQFPVDGAAGEGFTNVGSALVMSPSMVEKYLDAGKQVAAHAVLLPDGIRFSPSDSRRDWTNDIVEQIRNLYALHTSGNGDVSALDRWSGGDPLLALRDDGRVDLTPYFAALIRHRDKLNESLDRVDDIAREAQVNPLYLRHIASMLTAKEPASALLESLRQQSRAAMSVDDAPQLTAFVRGWQDRLWRFQSVGHFGMIRNWQVPENPSAEDLTKLASEDTPEGADQSAAPTDQSSLVTRLAESPREQVERAFDDFRSLFPAAMCYARIVPVDKGVTLILHHREDAHFARLMLNDDQRARLDRLWDELEYVSHDALRLVTGFEQLWQFATQDSDPKKFEPLEAPIRQRAADFEERLIATEPRHVEAGIEFAGRAWRRPLTQDDAAQLQSLYAALRAEELPHDQAIRLVIARVLTSPAFLYKLETPAPGTAPAPVTDVELASRLSYFLWSSLPDAELRQLAEAGQLHEPATLVAQSRRMLQDERARRLAEQFALQWLHVRDFDEFDEKNEQRFPQFASLRADMNEEGIRFFVNLLKNDESVLGILNADYVIVNRTLAEHYGIAWPDNTVPDDTAPATANDWRRIDDVHRFCRGGILTMASILSTQAGASRTSPILRGNWITETLLGERLPRPPANVPTLPESAPRGLTERQLIERHSSDPACAKCHARIDPYGFALEGFDAIGRRRSHDAAGLLIETGTRLPDGTEIDGLDGLRDYLVNERRDTFVRHFCRKLLGYALGRTVQLSDEPLLDEMATELAAHDFRISAAIEAIVRSQQFRYIRGEQNR